MGCKPLDAARCVVEMAKLPLDAKEFNEELYQSLESVFPEAQLMPGNATCVYMYFMFKRQFLVRGRE